MTEHELNVMSYSYSLGLPASYYIVPILLNEIRRYREVIKWHREQKADDRCWIDTQKIYALLEDGDLGDNSIGNEEAMLENCKRFIKLECSSNNIWKSYKELEEENKLLKDKIKKLEDSDDNSYIS